MCELLAMSANTPTDLCFSFTGLTRRGGVTGPHKDGWGVAFYEGKGIRCFHESDASASSRIAEVVQTHPIKSEVAICHIRQANVGDICLANTHPFIRELWGRYWVFAHNGQLAGFTAASGFYEAVGTTDSEALFCDILNHLRSDCDRSTSTEQVVERLVPTFPRLRSRGSIQSPVEQWGLAVYLLHDENGQYYSPGALWSRSSQRC